MTKTLCVQWTLTPAHPPRPLRHCATCGTTKPFISSGKVRLNANGRKLDAWLIYRCADCETSWLRRLLDRCPVDRIPKAELEAMEQSATAWVHGHEFDLAALKKEAESLVPNEGMRVIRPVRPDLCALPVAMRLSLAVSSPTDLRLDRFLCRELPISRSELRAHQAKGSLSVAPDNKNALRRPIRSDVSITLHGNAFSREDFALIRDALFAP